MPPSPSPSQALYDPRRRPLPRDFERPSYVPYGGGGGGGATAGSRDQYSGGVQQGYSRSEHGRDSRERGGWPTQGRVGGDRAPAGHMGGGPGRGFAGRAPPMRGHRGADLATIEHVTTNSFPAVLTPNFGFYQVSITIQDPQGKEVDSRFVKRIIFRKAMLDHHLRHLPPEPKRDAYRSYFFVGSYFFAIRNDPPFRTDEKMYRGPEGSLRIGKVQHYTAPLSLVAPQAPVPGTTRLGEVVVDAHRCSHCTRTFSTTQALLAHCANTGHQPVTSPFPVGTADHVPPSRPATMEVLAAYANCILQATLNGDPKLKKWGREHVDLESKTEPTDRNRRPLGIELYKAYSASFSVAAVPPSKDVSGPMRDRSKSGGGRPKSEWRGDADIGSVAHGDDNATAKLILTVDLKAKIMRTRTLLQILCGDRDPDRVTFSPEHQEWAKREWEGKTIIHRHEKRCTFVVVAGILEVEFFALLTC